MFNKQGFFVYIRIIRVRASYYVNNIYIYLYSTYLQRETFVTITYDKIW